MCGRYLRRSDKQRIAETFHLAKDLADLVLPAWDYNVAPTSFQPVIRADRDTGERELTLMRWGLVPYFAKDLKTFAYSTINARAESLTGSAIFRGPFERRRCLVPADGFYEWKRHPPSPAAAKQSGARKKQIDFPAQHTFEGENEPAALILTAAPDDQGAHPKRAAKKEDAKPRQPYAFTLADGKPLAFAGLWDRWRDPSGDRLESFTIITTTANELTAAVHNRMPVILRPEDYDRWLSTPPAAPAFDVAPPLELLALLRPFPAERMAVQPAHLDVGNVRNNHPGLLNSA